MNLAYAARKRQRTIKPAESLSGGSVQVFGENIYYEASGLVEDGPTILLLHDAGGTAATWHGQLVGLAQGARCIVPDLSGHGRSEGKGFTTVGEYCRSIMGFLDALAIRWPVVLAGACLGAAMAVETALRAPDRVAGLILAGPSEGGRACGETLEITARGDAPEAFIQGLFSSSVSQVLLSQRLKHWRLTSPTVRHGDLQAVRRYPMAVSLSRVFHPTLAIWGERDPVAATEQRQLLASALHNGRAVTIPKAGCLAMLEQPAAFNREITSFLEELRPAWPTLEQPALPGGYRRF